MPCNRLPNDATLRAHIIPLDFSRAQTFLNGCQEAVVHCAHHLELQWFPCFHDVLQKMDEMRAYKSEYLCFVQLPLICSHCIEPSGTYVYTGELSFRITVLRV